MKILYTKEIGNCDFVLRTLETNKAIKSCNELIGKNEYGNLVHINLDNVIKIVD